MPNNHPEPVEGPKTLLTYIRKSYVKTASDEISPARQRHAVKALASAHGLTCEWYQDAEGHSSGRHEHGRDAWLALRAQLHRPDVVGVGAYCLDRIYRNVKEFLEFTDELARRDLRLILVKENIDTGTATGRAVATMLMTMAQLESDLASERMTSAIDYLRRIQGRHWGAIPFACQRTNGHLTASTTGYWLNPTTGDATLADQPPDPNWEHRTWHDALQAAYQLYTTHELSYIRLADRLNALGWRCHHRDGSLHKWTFSKARNALHRWRIYAGELVIQSSETIEGAHQPILSPQLCQAVGVKLASRTHISGPGRRSDTIYLLSNIAYCGDCGRKINGAIRYGRRTYRHIGPKGDCTEPSYTPADPIEQHILQRLTPILTNGLLDKIRTEIKNAARALGGDVAQTTLTKIETQKTRLARLTDLYVDSILAKPEYLRRRQAIEAQITILRTQLPRSPGNLDAILEQLTELLTELHQAPPARQKELLNTLFERVEIRAGQTTNITPRPQFVPLFALDPTNR